MAKTASSLPFVYDDLDAHPIELANQFLIQHVGDEFLLTVGQFAPPAVLGTPEQQEARRREIENIPVRVLARVAMTPARMRELVTVLTTHLEKWDAMRERAAGSEVH